MDERKDVKDGRDNETFKRIKELTEEGYGLVEMAMDINPEKEDEINTKRKPDNES